jgi:amino acid transporter
VTKNAPAREAHHELRGDGVSAAGSVVMAVAGSAPAYSITATTAVLIAAAGLASPAALLWCGLPMLGIAWAFAYLGRADVNAGAAYSWVGRALHPVLGFLAGWALVVSTTIFMVAGALPAGAATVSLFDEKAASNTLLVTFVGAGWFLIMVLAVLLGVTVTARAQWIMSTVEVGLLVIFAVVAIVRIATGHHAGPSFDWSWFGFGHFSGVGGFVAAALVAAFYYWGWDVSSNLNEETKGGSRAAGRAGIIGVIVVFLLFEVFTVVVQMILPAKTIAAGNGNILPILGDVLWPGIGGKILVVAVALSTIAGLETTLIQVTRSLFAMGRDHTIPLVFGRAHKKWRTPAFATVVVAGVSMIFFVGSNFLGSVGQILSDAVSSIGLQIAFYYALAAIAVIVAYRRVIFTSVKNFVFIALWPGLGAVFMVFVFVTAIPNSTPIVVAIGLGSLALGFVPIVVFWRKGRGYFGRRPLELPDEIVADRPRLAPNDPRAQDLPPA